MSDTFDAEAALLWQAFLDGGLDEAQVAALELRLRDDPALAALAGERYVEHRLLSLALRQEPADRFAQATLARVAAEGQDFSRKVQSRIVPAALPPPARRLAWPHYALAASLAACLALALAWWRTPLPAAALGPVATLVVADHCRWEGAGLVSGQRVMNGPLRLLSGNALLRFDGGAEMLLAGAAELDLDSPGSAALVYGRVTVRASEQAAGFILRTPVSEVTDLGTEFALSVERGGATDLQVIEGEVAWRALHAGATAGGQGEAGSVLRQGQGVRLRSASDAGEALDRPAATLATQVDQLSGADPGRLLSYEPFAYTVAHTTSQAQDAHGGSGWRAPWFRNQPTTLLPIDFTPGRNLVMPAGLLPAAGGCLELPCEPTKPDTYRDACMRYYVEPIDLSHDGVRYLSLLVSRSATTAGPTHHWFRCMLTSETVAKDRLGFGIMSNGCPHLLNRFGNTNGSVPIRDGRSYLCVLKVVCGRTTPDQAFLKVYDQDDVVDRHEPAAWTLVGQPGSYDGVLGSIHINNGTERAWSVDELRIGTSWSAVTPRP